MESVFNKIDKLDLLVIFLFFLNNIYIINIAINIYVSVFETSYLGAIDLLDGTKYNLKNENE